VGGFGIPESSIMTTISLHRTTIDSPVGELGLVATSTALVAVLWPEERDGRVRFAVEPTDGSNEILTQTADQLGEYFDGDRRVFDLSLELRGTDFQQEVWQSLADIAYGETSTYGKQAVAIGRPRAIRAVGSANGRNPLSIVLPCHRIVGADGKLAGFAGGLDTKRWLLDHESGVAGR
jgi:methylated-DNA-[protein]-cysteine S-methyltransferase